MGILTIELKEELAGYTKTLVRRGMAVGAVLVGLALLNVALAFLASDFFRALNVNRTVQYAFGFAFGETAYGAPEDCGTTLGIRPAVASKQ